MTYIAENLPAYDVIKDWPHRPTDDMGWAMTASHTVATGPDEERVRYGLAMHLITSTVGIPADRQRIFIAAAEAIEAGVDAVQISGRVYRIRKES